MSTHGGPRKGAGRPRKADRGKPVQFYLSAATVAQITALAESQGKPKSAVVAAAIRMAANIACLPGSS